MKTLYWVVYLGLGIIGVVCLAIGASAYFPNQGTHSLLNQSRRRGR